jgi:hypothetical protein
VCGWGLLHDEHSPLNTNCDVARNYKPSAKTKRSIAQANILETQQNEHSHMYIFVIIMASFCVHYKLHFIQGCSYASKLNI